MAFLKTLLLQTSGLRLAVLPSASEVQFSPSLCTMEDYFINESNDTLSLVLMSFVMVLCNV